VAYTSPEYVVRLKSRTGPAIVFTLVFLYAIWFTIVLLGEQQAFTVDPGKWTGLEAKIWAYIGLVLLVAATLYFIILLVRREVPSKVYVLQPPAGEGRTASFLEPSPGPTTTAEPQPPPQS